MQQCSNATMQQCSNAAMQQCNNATMQQCNNATMQQCNNATTQQHNNITTQHAHQLICINLFVTLHHFHSLSKPNPPMLHPLCCLLLKPQDTTTTQIPLLPLFLPYPSIHTKSTLSISLLSHIISPNLPMLSTPGIHCLCHFNCSLFLPVDRLLCIQSSGCKGSVMPHSLFQNEMKNKGITPLCLDDNTCCNVPDTAPTGSDWQSICIHRP